MRWPWDRGSESAPQQYRGNEQTLLRYWRSRMAGGHYGDYLDCVATLSGKPGIGDAHGLCNWLHKQATGVYPGQEAGGRKKAEEQLAAEAGTYLADQFARLFVDPATDPQGSDAAAVHERIERAAATIAALAALLAAGKRTKAAFTAAVLARLQDDGEAVGDFSDDDGELADDVDRYAQHVVDDDASVKQLAAWGMALAGAGIWQSYQRGKLSDSPAAALWNWNAAPDACPGCDVKAGDSPYRRDELPGMPGDGSTPCGGHCRCFLERAR